MPLECERSATSPSASGATVTTTTTTGTEGGLASAALIASEIQSSSSSHFNEEVTISTLQTSVMEGDMSTSQTSTTSNSSSCTGGRKTSITSPDPTAYVAKARVTRPTPPPPPYNPMQFVQIKPCNLYQTAQEQLKKAEEVKKIKEIRKEEPEDWQNNLDNWKSSRRKRVEHIIDRVVEVKKLELEEHDRTRRKSKTFSEMIEDRGERVGRPALKKLASLAVYTEDESNDLSDLGIGTSSASGKSSLSEDYDNNSVMSDNAAELDKAISNSNHKPPTDSTTREYISSPGYETSSSTAPASTPDPCEYTYEGAIQDYKQRVSRAAAASGQTSQALSKLNTHTQQQQNSKESTPERPVVKESSAYPPRRGSKIEDRLIGFEVQSPSEECVVGEKKVDVPKIDISKRKEIFESQAAVNDTKSQVSSSSSTTNANSASIVVPRVTLRDRFKPSQQESAETVEVSAKKDVKRMSGDITSIKERLQNLEQQQNLVNGANGASKTTANKLVDIPVPPLKERLSSLQNAVTKEEAVRKQPVALVDARQLEIMKSEEEKAKQTLKEEVSNSVTTISQITSNNSHQTTTSTTTSGTKNDYNEVDRDDSGIHTADDIDVAEERLHPEHIKKEQELKLSAAIEALAMEEKQFAEAANAVNQIEAEFEELTLGSVALPPLASSNQLNNKNSNSVPNAATSAVVAATASSSTTTTTITNDHMEYSVSSTNQPTPSSTCLPPQSTTTTTPISSGSSNHNNNNISNCSSLLQNSAVKGTTPPTGGSSNLRRKPTNEMVHAKNLLRIFKDTFQNDIELDEDEDRQEQETKTIPQQAENEMGKPGIGIETKALPNTAAKTPLSPILSRASTEAPLSPKLSRASTETPLSPILSRASTETPLSPILSRPNGQRVTTATSPNSVANSMIPRCVTPSGKPPMSPITVRSTTKFRDETPPGSPTATSKHDSQFSINGRVEIFNSKQMNLDDIAKIPLPAQKTTTKITYLPQITTATQPSGGTVTPKSAAAASNNIVLPEQEQTDLPGHPSSATLAATALPTEQPTNQATSTVIEPLSIEIEATQSVAEKKSLFEMKSMPSRQMVNEPQITRAKTVNAATKTLDRVVATATSASQPSHGSSSSNNGALKQQQPQPAAQQPEVVVCAPPITIVNPDELPKPNTVKNLSSCFQQPNVPAAHSNAGVGSKLISSKPLAAAAARSRIPQATPPQSPITVKLDVVTDKTEKSSLAIAANPLDEEKKLSMVSSSSTSSNSTASTVIEANKTLSIMSNASSVSIESAIIPPTIVETNAQIHKEPARESMKSVGFSKQNSDGVKLAANKIDKEIASQVINKKEDKSIEISKEKAKPSTDLVSKSAEKNVKSQKSTESKTFEKDEVDMKALMKDFLKTEIQFSETCESKPLTKLLPFQSQLQPLKVVIKETEDIKGNVQPANPLNIPGTTKVGIRQNVGTPISPILPQTNINNTPSSPAVLKTAKVELTKDTVDCALPQCNKPPLTIDVSQGNIYKANSPMSPLSPKSPASQLFRNTKPLVVSTLYDKYLPQEPRSPKDLEPPSNMRSNLPSPKFPSEKPETPTIVIPAELPHLVDCPANESTLYKLASSAPHSPVSTTSSTHGEPPQSVDIDSALCSSLLASMAATPDFVNFNRQQTVEEDLCQKVDVNAMPSDKHTPCTGFADISKKDIKHAQGITTKIIHKMQDAPAAPTAVDEICEKIDINALPDDKKHIKTGFKVVSPTEIKKCDNLFGSAAPQSPIMEARAAHSKALIETCEKIIAEEKQVNNQMKSTLPLSPKATPLAQRKSKIPKPLPSCCLTTESMNEADHPDRPSVEYRQSPTAAAPSSPKDDGVIARMHVVETQIKVTTTTPPLSPTSKVATPTPPPPKPQPSPQMGKKTKNIFDFIKKNFGVGGGGHKEEEVAKNLEPAAAVATSSDSKALVLSEKDLQTLDQVKYDEIHNVENSKFYLPADDVAPPPLPKTPAPVNIEITRKVITDEILEDGKTEMEFSSEIDALLDQELNKLNHEIEELDKVAAATTTSADK